MLLTINKQSMAEPTNHHHIESIVRFKQGVR